jgi:hypothetical protein
VRIFDLTPPAGLTCLLLTVSACGTAVPQDNQSTAVVQPHNSIAIPQSGSPAPSLRPDAMVAGFYKEVVARQPIAGMGDPKVFGPYLSEGLLKRFADNDACFADWQRQNRGSTDKPPFGQLEMGVYSGSSERSHLQRFDIEKTETGKNGSSRVYVKLAYVEPAFKLLWRVAVVVVRQNGRSLVEDVIYLKDKDNPDEYRLSQVLLGLGEGCKGPHWRG